VRDFRYFHVDVTDRIADVVVEKPPLNSLDYEMYAELSDLVAELEAEPEVRVVVLRSSIEGIFLAGADIKDMVDYDRRRGPLAHKIDTVHTTFMRLQHLSKPTIGAITGHALGGGCELALCLDFRIMTEGPARIGQPEVDLGIIPGGGGTQRLTRLVGRARATEMLMLGQRLTANEALGAGLVNQVGRDDTETLRLARELATGLASRAPIALAAVKKAINDGVDGDLPLGLSVEREAVLGALQSDDAAEGVSAFLAKRNPEWRGR
jgi:enoyl-CoA hydratase